MKARDIKDKYLAISFHVKTDFLHIAMEDNAGGIKKENIEKIFDPYFTTKSHTGGSGLGLYIAKIIIEKNMEGKLKVTNTDKGASFEILIPHI